MKPLYLVAASALALGAAACGPKTPPARAALDCPMTQGELTRTSSSPDGKVCTYSTTDGAEVTLQLVSVQGAGVDAALSNIETTLLADRAAPKAEDVAAKGEDAEATAEDKAEQAKAVSSAERAAKEADEDASVRVKVDGKDEDAVHVEVKGGKTVVSEARDGTTRVSLPGIHIVADEANDRADVKVGPIRINAGDDGATIRMRRDVRLRGEALNPEKRGLRAMFLYTGDDLPDGYRYVGYEAGGPKRGPITVAVVRSKSEHTDVDEIADDVRRLVRKNGGV